MTPTQTADFIARVRALLRDYRAHQQRRERPGRKVT